MNADNQLLCPNCHTTALVSHSSTRFTCKACGFLTARTFKPQQLKMRPVKFKRLFITCAVEGQPLHKPALAVVKKYCEVTGAELVVIPRDYYLSQPAMMRPADRGKSLEWKRQRRKYAKGIVPYLRRPDWQLNNNLRLRGSAYISPTNQNVLSGKLPLGAGHSLILAHPQQAFEDTYGGGERGVLRIMTTGAITKAVYSASEVGDKAEFHHVLGGLIVEIRDNKVFYTRHVGFASDGSFQDLDTVWTAEGPTDAPRTEALVFGDLHCAERVKTVFDDQFMPGGLVDRLRPKRVMIHDGLDGFFINHHKSVFEMAAGHDSLADTAAEIDEFVKLFQWACDLYPDTQFVAVGSNHTDWFTKWAAGECKSTRRAVLLLHAKLRAWLFERATNPQRVPEAMDFVAALINRKNFKVLHSSDQLEVKGVELSLHGHRGPLGSRATIKTFAKLGTKGMSGHRHQAGRYLGWMIVGTCGPTKGGYRDPIDAATHTHGLLYGSGKRTHVTFFKDQCYIDWREGVKK